MPLCQWSHNLSGYSISDALTSPSRFPHFKSPVLQITIYFFKPTVSSIILYETVSQGFLICGFLNAGDPIYIFLSAINFAFSSLFAGSNRLFSVTCPHQWCTVQFPG